MAERIEIIVDGNARPYSLATEKAERSTRELGRTVRAENAKTAVSTKAAARESNAFGLSLGRAGRDGDYMRRSLSLIKWPAVIAGAGGAAQGISALSAGAVGLTSALAPLSGLLVAYPALLGTFGQVAGTVAVAGVSDLTSAVGGLNEKLDEESEAFKALSPQAQRFARELQMAKAPMRDLQSAVQGDLFGHLDVALEGVMEFAGGPLRSVLRDTAEELGRLAEQGGRFLSREGFGRDFETIGRNNVELLDDLGGAGFNFADALRHVMVEAGPLLDWLGNGVLAFSRLVEEEAKAARKSGELGDFFEETRDTMERVVSIGQSLGSVLIEIGRAADPLGEDILKSLDEGADDLERWAESAEGRNSLRQFFDDARPAIFEAGRLVGDLSEAFFELSTTPGLTHFMREIRKDLLPALVEMTEVATVEFGPELVDFLTEAAELMSTFVGSSGPLTEFVSLLGTAAGALNDLLETIPELSSVAVSALGGLSIAKLFGFSPTASKAAGAAAGTQVAAGMSASVLAADIVGGSLFAKATALKEKAFTVGKTVLGVNLALGVASGITSEAPNIEGQVQDALSMASLGLIPSWQEDAERLAGTFERGLEQGLEGIDIESSVDIDLSGLNRDELPALSRILGDTTNGFRRAREATRDWREALRHARDEGQISEEQYDQLTGSVNRAWRQFDRGKEKADELRGEIRKLRITWADNLGEISDRTEENMRKIERSFGRHSKQGKELLADNFDAAVDAIKKAMAESEISVDRGMEKIDDLIRKRLSLFGVKGPDAEKIIRSGGPGPDDSPGGLQRGGPPSVFEGPIVGPGRTGDRHHIVAEDGEYMLNREAVKAIGVRNLDLWNFGHFPRDARPMATGGIVELLGPHNDPEGHGGSNMHLHIAILADQVLIALGKRLQSMGWLVGEHPAFGGVTPGVHAADGYHPTGDAIDVNWPNASQEFAKIKALLPMLDRLVGGGGGAGALGGFDLNLPEFSSPFAAFMPAAEQLNLAGKTLEREIQERLGSIEGMEAGVGGGVLSEEEFIAVALEGLRITNKFAPTRANAQKLLTLAKQESSLDPRSINNWDSNAQAGNPSGGLMHTTESTFRAYHQPGTANTYFDALASIAASINYQAAEYGSLVTHSPYELGGLVGRIADVKEKIETIRDQLDQSRNNPREQERIREIKDLLEQKGIGRDRRKELEAELKALQGSKEDLSPEEREALKEREDDLRDKLAQLRKDLAKKRRKKGRKISRRKAPLLEEALEGIDHEIAVSDENITLAEGRATHEDSGAGVDYDQGEVDMLGGLYNTLLTQLFGKRDRVNVLSAQATTRLEAVEKELDEDRRKQPSKRMAKWKREALRENRTRLRQLLDDAPLELEDVQGVTGAGGRINDTQQLLADLGVTPQEPVEDPNLEALNQLLEEKAARETLRANLATAHLADFGEFFRELPGLPYLGAFAQGTGGLRVGRTGLAVLHRDEMVQPDPKGPFGSQVAAPATVGRDTPVEVVLMVDGDVGPLLQRVRAEVDGRAVDVVDTKLGRRRRQFQTAPGR